MKNEKYIQLPLLERDLDAEVVKIIWLVAKMSEQDRAEVQDMLRKLNRDKYSTEHVQTLIKEMEDANIKVDPTCQEFVKEFRKLITHIIAESSQCAVKIYKEYCIDGKSVKAIAKETEIDENFIRLYTALYDVLKQKETGTTS